MNLTKLKKSDYQYGDGYSIPMQIGKAAEHLVCAELLVQGHKAFLADAGLPYDIVIDNQDGTFARIQVKATTQMFRRNPDRKGANVPVYRFAVRRTGRDYSCRKVSAGHYDCIACVALDTKQVAFIPIVDATGKDGFCKSLIELKSRRIEYNRKGKTGKDPAKHGKFIEDYAKYR